MGTLPPIIILKAIELMEKDYKDRRLGEAHSGGYGDGGYSDAIERIKIFQTVWDGKELNERNIPEFLKFYIKRFEKISDPEYKEFLRLKKKFD